MSDNLWIVAILVIALIARHYVRPLADAFGERVAEILSDLSDGHNKTPRGARLKRVWQRARESFVSKWVVERVSLIKSFCQRLKVIPGQYAMKLGKHSLVIAACIIAIGFLLSDLFPRYQVAGIGENGEYVRRFDRWTGKVCTHRVLGTDVQWQAGFGWQCF